MKKPNKVFSHYHKRVEGLEWVDVYRVLELFNVTDPAIAHAVKKLLVAGGRGAGKSINQDVSEAIVSLRRWQQMRAEDQRAAIKGAFLLDSKKYIAKPSKSGIISTSKQKPAQEVQDGDSDQGQA